MAKPYYKNPRKIGAAEMELLEESLEELGDLSGVVHDLNSDQVIGGNQRSDVFDLNRCEIEMVERREEPDEQGTVGHGFIHWRGGRYAYRQVRWSAAQCERANIRANKLGGEWDFAVLLKDFERSVVLDSGFKEDELAVALAGLETAVNAISPDDEPPTEWKEYDETAADDVEFITCPHCGEKFPK